MFGQGATVRDLFYAKPDVKGISIQEDKKFPLEGKSSGSLRTKKFWNGFGSTRQGTFLNYDIEDGVVSSSLVDGSKGQHIYLVDIFHYGIHGLDIPVPGPKDMGKKRSNPDVAKGGSVKRQKSESSVDSEMEDLRLSESLTGNPVEDLGYVEKPALGLVRIISNMKLYWYDPK
ncbi:MAG: hypothetical protein LQ341_007843 [Variospora aurantia]|nr:MAG: hypothetical protein LQ341_007843 [Variospora aurantia]